MSDVSPLKAEKFEGHIFEIRIQGHLHERWSDRFAGLTITKQSDGTTTFCGLLPDQTALHGVLLQIRNMNLRLISVNLVGGTDLGPQRIRETLKTKDLKATFQRFLEEIRNKGNLDAWNELIAPAYVEHQYPFGDLDFKAAKDSTEMLRTAFSDRKVSLEEILVEGDTVVIRWNTQGVHTGEIFGISPTGKNVETTGCTIYRLDRGKVIEAYVYEDWLGFFQQLGVVPLIGQETA